MKYSTLILPEIYRITFPYKDIYTTVCIIRTPGGDAVIDLASYDEDMDEILFPALEEAGVTKESLKYAVITHNHKDHAGGLARFLQVFGDCTIVAGSDSFKESYPEAKLLVAKEGDIFLDCLRITEIPGHTVDAIGVVDERSKLLLCGDCLQQYGIFGSGLWGSNIRYPALHLEAISKLRTLGLKAILGAHDFHPVGFYADTEEKALAVLDASAASLAAIRAHLEENPELSPEELADRYNAPGTLPTVGKHVFAAIRRDIENGKF